MSETSRLMFTVVVKVDEETRGRWRLAADRVGMDLAEWIGDTCAVASDPESGQVVDCRARLTTAETERDQLQGEVGDGMMELEVETNRRSAAEARVEALEALLGRVLADPAAIVEVRAGIARAALACPPQQRGE